MSYPSIIRRCAFTASLVTAVVLAPLTVASATSTPLPQTAAAAKAAVWLAGQLNANGYLESSGSIDYSDTALTPLALAAADPNTLALVANINFLEEPTTIATYVDDDGANGPGQLATLILDAVATHHSPTDFGGVNLVSELEATMRTTGAQKGLFGSQAPTYDGAYRQGLALAALAAAGVVDTTTIRPAITWLKNQQCANGGWEAYRSSLKKPCTKTSATDYSGPDTNSTALAVEGLVAQKTKLTHNALSFFASLEAKSGGWGYYGGADDPDSTALVIQALLALKQNVGAARWTKGTHDPASAELTFQLRSGAMYYPGSKTPSVLATEQAIPALAAVTF